MDLKEQMKNVKKENHEITNLKYEILVCPDRKIRRNMVRRLLKMCGIKKVNKNLSYYWKKDRFTTL